MKWLLKWYYWYKNFWDELLLLWIIPYIFTHHSLSLLYIEAKDPVRLQERLDRHSDILGIDTNKLVVIPKYKGLIYARDILFLGWWECLTDWRKFPYNWWTYLLYLFHILSKEIHIYWWLGNPNSVFSRFLWSFILWRAKTITVREKRSLQVAHLFGWNIHKSILYHDFALDVLNNTPSMGVFNNQKTIWVINCTPYKRSEEIKTAIIKRGIRYSELLFFPGEVAQDTAMYHILTKSIPSLVYYDWTTKHINTICSDVQLRTGVYASRLHVLLLAKTYNIPFTPIVYQEKIATFLRE
jgi:hypothetical protein